MKTQKTTTTLLIIVGAFICVLGVMLKIEQVTISNIVLGIGVVLEVIGLAMAGVYTFMKKRNKIIPGTE